LHIGGLSNKLEGGDSWSLELLFISKCPFELLKLEIQATSLQLSSSNEDKCINDNKFENKIDSRSYESYNRK
jgi:hypothetical protein